VSHVIAVKLDQVEGIKEHMAVIAPVAQPAEYRHASIITGHTLAIDQARRSLGARTISRKAAGPVVPVAGEEPYARSIAAQRKPSCLISCSHPPAGGFVAGLGRQGGTKPAASIRMDAQRPFQCV
jgi:hypothetical protein